MQWEGRKIKTRILSAIVILPLLVALILYSGPALFNLVLSVVATLALLEFYRMVLPEGRRMESSIAAAWGLILAAAIGWQHLELALLVLSFAFVSLACIFLCRFRDLDKVVFELAVTLFGLLYVPLLLAHLGLLRALPYGQKWVFLALLLVMASDTFAYFVGRSIGKRKLYEAISPNKSIEGALGGLLGSLVAAWIYRHFFFPDLSLIAFTVMALVVNIAAQSGDLFESMLKRSSKVKDSGNVIPGHGGLLDRLDSLLFAFPVTYYFIVFVMF